MELDGPRAENADVINIKKPKRVLHFSDGVLEEYSEDEVDAAQQENTDVIDPKTLNWGPWILFKTWNAGYATLNIVDYLGERLAWILGITSPKYQSELNEFEKMEAERIKQENNVGDWSKPHNNPGDLQTNQPGLESSSV